MQQRNFNDILAVIAMKHHTTVEDVRREMEIALQNGLSNPDPAIRAQWAKIPSKGSIPTLEEFVSYLASQIKKR